MTVDKQTGSLVGRPEIVTRGFVGIPEPSLIAGATQRVTKVLAGPGDRQTIPMKPLKSNDILVRMAVGLLVSASLAKAARLS